MATRLGELVERFGGHLKGDPDLRITAIAPLDRAGASDISFLVNSKMRALAAHSHAAALILTPADDAEVAAAYGGARIVADNPYAYFARTAQLLVAQHEAPPAPGRHPSAVVHESARIHPSAHIGPLVTVEAGAVIQAGAVIEAGCYIGRDAVVGENTRFYPNATFHARCIIGARGIVHSGAVIGDDGFGFALDGGEYIKIPQIGRVVIGDDVDIGSNTTIDRGALDDTVIEDGVKLDNQIQIGHNCHIGAHTAMAGCVGMAGSTKVGKHCTFGGASMINGHIEIGDNVHITASTMVPRSISEPGRYTGYYPMSSNTEFERGAAIVRNLASYRDRIRALEKAVEALSPHKEDAG
ncbi:MAG: UDP-3-O-(3-hydroxymyristoyl)glucosamine N-acyltransferase [Telluria sp.]